MSWVYVHVLSGDGGYFDTENGDKCSVCGKKFASVMIERHEIRIIKNSTEKELEVVGLEQE